MDADTGGHRVLIVLDARRQIVNRCPGRRVGNIYVERFIGAPQDVLDVESHFPFRGRPEAHAPSEVGRQREFRFDASAAQVGNHSRCLEDLPDFGRGIQEVGRAACDFHLHFRTIGETEGPFRGNVPQDTYVYADRSFGIAFEPGGYQGAISCLGEQFGVLSLPCGGQQSGDRIVRRFADGEHGARQVERTPGDRHADTYREFIPEFVGDRRLQCIGLQVDALDQMCSDPVVAPVHGRAVRGIKSQADGQIFGGFVIEIGVERRRNLVVRVGLDLRIAPVVVVRQVRCIGFDARDADREGESGGLEGGSRRVEVDRLGIEFHTCSHVSHSQLFCTQGIDLVAFGADRRCEQQGRDR